MELHPSLKKYIDILKGEKPGAQPVKPAPLGCDPESKALWKDLKESSEMKTCCKVIQYGFKHNMTTIEYSFKKPLDGVSAFDIPMRYCPSCGRKLK